MLIPFQFNQKQHQILPDPEFVDFLRRRFPKQGPHFFVYRHLRTGAFVLAGWVQKEVGRMVDLHNLGGHPSISRDDVRDLDFLLDPPSEAVLTRQRFDREMANAERAENLEAQTENEEYLDVKRHVIKKYVKNPGPVFNDVLKHPKGLA